MWKNRGINNLHVSLLVCLVNHTSFSAHISENYSLPISDTKADSLYHMAHSSDPDKTLLFGFWCSSALYNSVRKIFNSLSYTSCLQSSMALHIPTQFHPLCLVCSPSFTKSLLKCAEQSRATALFQWSQGSAPDQYTHLEQSSLGKTNTKSHSLFKLNSYLPSCSLAFQSFPFVFLNFKFRLLEKTSSL